MAAWCACTGHAHTHHAMRTRAHARACPQSAPGLQARLHAVMPLHYVTLLWLLEGGHTTSLDWWVGCTQGKGSEQPRCCWAHVSGDLT